MRQETALSTSNDLSPNPAPKREATAKKGGDGARRLDGPAVEAEVQEALALDDSTDPL